MAHGGIVNAVHSSFITNISLSKNVLAKVIQTYKRSKVTNRMPYLLSD